MWSGFELATNTGIPSLTAMHHGTAGIALSLGERVDEAVRELEMTLTMATEIGSPELAGLAHRQLLLVRTILNDLPVAAFHGRLALQNFLNTGLKYTAWVTIRWATITMATAGLAWEAIALDAACRQSTISTRRFARERELWEPLHATATATLPDPSTAISDGQALTEPQAFALALQTLDTIQRDSQATPQRKAP